MIKKNLIPIVFAILLFAPDAFSQEFMKKDLKEKKDKSGWGGDVVLLESKVKVVDKTRYKVFEIEASKPGNYYMDIWTLGAGLKEGGLIDYDVIVNDVETGMKIFPTQNNWSMASMMTADKQIGKIKLHKGKNAIAFVSETSFLPQVETISLSTSKDKANISGEHYDKFVERIRKSPSKPKLKSAQASSGSPGWENPGGNYFFAMNADVKYTFFVEDFYFQHDLVTIDSYGVNDFPHVLYFYKANMWDANDLSKVYSDGGYNYTASEIDIPTSGGYGVMVRPLIPGTEGLVNMYITINGVSHYYSNCPVSGGIYECLQTSVDAQVLNTFTCHLSSPGITRLYLDEALEYDPDYPEQQGRIIAVNDSYYSTLPKDYNWSMVSRIKLDTSYPASRNIILTTNSSFHPEGTCDLYAGCLQYFLSLAAYPETACPNLKFDDAIQSKSFGKTCLNRYNCILWSGGITDNLDPIPAGYDCNGYSGTWDFFPSNSTSDYAVILPNGRADELASFDKYYGDPMRYMYMINDSVRPCMVYTRSGATYNNSILDLWRDNAGEYQHASVRGNANYHPHGYDWESKLGPEQRIFHPRHALEGGIYGYIYKHYRQNPNYTYSYAVKNIDEAIADGTSVIEQVRLSASETLWLEKYTESLPQPLIAEFESKFEAWKQTWSKPEMLYYSNPRMFAKGKEYELFIAFCQEKGKAVWPLVFNKYIQGDYLTSNAIDDLTLIDNLPNVAILKAIKEYNKQNKFTGKGEFIVRSPHSNRIKYIRKLMETGFSPAVFRSVNGVSEIDKETVMYSNRHELSVAYDKAGSVAIEFPLQKDAQVSLSVHSLQAPVYSVLDGSTLPQGEHKYTWNCAGYPPGVYLVKLYVDGNITIKKIIINR